MIHREESPLAGESVTVFTVPTEPPIFEVEDWWDRIQGTSWRDSTHYLAIDYTHRKSVYDLPDDDNVLYGYMGGSEKLIHVTETNLFPG